MTAIAGTITTVLVILVVIALIAILAIVGVAVFQGAKIRPTFSNIEKHNYE